MVHKIYTNIYLYEGHEKGNGAQNAENSQAEADDGTQWMVWNVENRQHPIEWKQNTFLAVGSQLLLLSIICFPCLYFFLLCVVYSLDSLMKKSQLLMPCAHLQWYLSYWTLL